MNTNETTHFGYQQVPIEEKQRRVARVFDSVAQRYDLMNDLMSFGIHRLWKRILITSAAPRPGQRVLDLAGGTGDIAALFCDAVGPQGDVTLADINRAMLQVGRDRLRDRGYAQGLRFTQANAEALPFPDNSFDRISIGFGLRNVTHKEQALAEMFRVLRPGGRALVLEFSKPVLPMLDRLYDAYSFQVIPSVGEWITGDRDSYQYLSESIRMHPDQVTLAGMMRTAGFEDVSYLNLTGGIVALHRGFKF